MKHSDYEDVDCQVQVEVAGGPGGGVVWCPVCDETVFSAP